MSINGHTNGYIKKRRRVTLKRTVRRSVSLVTMFSADFTSVNGSTSEVSVTRIAFFKD